MQFVSIGRLGLWGVLALLAPSAQAADPAIQGAGSSAAAPIYQSWAQAYTRSSGVALRYEPSGSSAGLQKIRAGQVDFGASDVAPSDADLAKDGLLVFPVAITGVVPVVNLPKLGEGQLRLSGEVLARIFLGAITDWHAPEIAQLNPGLILPRLPIKLVVRSDGSGTTYNFADYLAKVSAGWKEQRGVQTSLKWQDGVIAVKGSAAVADAVKATAGAIGYIDFDYIAEHRLNPVQMRNAEGDFVAASNQAFRQALSQSAWMSRAAFTSTLTEQPGKGAWPLTMGTYALVPAVAGDAEQAQRTLKFFVWAFTHGDELVKQRNFVRLPDRVQAAAFKVISGVKDKSGKPIGMVY